MKNRVIGIERNNWVIIIQIEEGEPIMREVEKAPVQKVGHQFSVVGKIYRKECKDKEIGLAKAGFYVEEKVGVIWCCDIYAAFDDSSYDPSHDFILKMFWKYFEEFFINKLGARKIFVEKRDRIYRSELREKFFREMGYIEFGESFFLKKSCSPRDCIFSGGVIYVMFTLYQ